MTLITHIDTESYLLELKQYKEDLLSRFLDANTLQLQFGAGSTR